MTESRLIEVRLASTAAALIVGNELLSGKVQDTNVHALARTLRALGVSLTRVVVLRDEVQAVAREVRRLARSHDALFTSGGVGGTHDDVTVQAVAAAFKVPVVIEPELARRLRLHYGSRFTDAHLRLARAPEGACLAPSADSDWPTIVMHNVWLLPGVPELFRSKLATLRHWLKGPCGYYSRAVYLAAEEANLVTLLDRLSQADPDVEIGSYPKWFDPSYKTKVTFDSRDQGAADRALERFLAALSPEKPLRIE